MEIEQQTVAQDGRGQGADVFVGDVIAVTEQRAGLGGQHDKLRGAYAGAEVHVVLDEIGSSGIVGTGGANQLHRVTGDCVANRHHANELLEIENLFGIRDGVHLGHFGGGSEVHHFHFVVGREIVEYGIEKEAVELRFGKRISTFQLDGVLR